MLRHITNAIFGSSQTALEAEIATELGQILKRGILKDKLLSAENLADFQEFPIPLDTKIKLLISCIRDAYQLPDIIYEIQYQDDKPIINITSDLITEDNYKTLIALCARFEFDVISPINDKKRISHPFDQFDAGIVDVIISYTDDFARCAFWQDPLFRDSVLANQPTEEWLRSARELYSMKLNSHFIELTSCFESQVKADFAKASWYKGNGFKMISATVGLSVGLVGMSISGYFVSVIRSSKNTLLKKLKDITWWDDHYRSTQNCADRYRLEVDLVDKCNPVKGRVYTKCVEPCDEFYKLGLLMLAPGFGFTISSLLTVYSLYLINENRTNREYYLGKFNACEYSSEIKKAADVLIAEAKNIINQKSSPEMQREAENYYLINLVKMNSSVTPIRDVLHMARGLTTCTHARIQVIMQKLQVEQKTPAIPAIPQIQAASSTPELAIDISSDSETFRFPRPFTFARLGSFRPDMTQRLLDDGDDESISFQLQ